MGTRVLVTGARGAVGGHLTRLLAAAGADVRAVPGGLPTGPPGGPCGASALNGTDAVFLAAPPPAADPATLAALADVPRVVTCGVPAAVEHAVADALRTGGGRATVLRPAALARDALGWAPQVRTGVVRWPYPDAARAPVHEADVAAVAARALTEPGHEGAVYRLTGPEVLTQAEQVAVIGRALGRPVRYGELSTTAARAHLVACGWSPACAAEAMALLAAAVDRPEQVTGTVAAITGSAASTFASWVSAHVAEFV